jgi:hypothetical protein
MSIDPETGYDDSGCWCVCGRERVREAGDWCEHCRDEEAVLDGARAEPAVTPDAPVSLPTIGRWDRVGTVATGRDWAGSTCDLCDEEIAPGDTVGHDVCCDAPGHQVVAHARCIHRSLAARVALPNAPTWGDLVRAVADLGVREDEPLAAIEWGVTSTGSGRLCVEREDDGAVVLRERRKR